MDCTRWNRSRNGNKLKLIWEGVAPSHILGRDMELKKGLKRINILAKGSMWWQCPQKGENEEIWGLNGTYRDNPADRLFMMHDIHFHFQQEDQDAVAAINALEIPLYTNVKYPFFDNNIVYPIKEVVDYHKTAWFSNVVCYMIALAIMQKPEEIGMYGVEMVGDEYIHERPAVLYWCGVAHGHGIEIVTPKGSKLFFPSTPESLMYGFRFHKDNNGLAYVTPKLQNKKAAQKYEWVPIGEEFDVEETPIEIYSKARGIPVGPK